RISYLPPTAAPTNEEYVAATRLRPLEMRPVRRAAVPKPHWEERGSQHSVKFTARPWRRRRLCTPARARVEETGQLAEYPRDLRGDRHMCKFVPAMCHGTPG